jgi:hypothetical protein
MADDWSGFSDAPAQPNAAPPQPSTATPTGDDWSSFPEAPPTDQGETTSTQPISDQRYTQAEAGAFFHQIPVIGRHVDQAAAALQAAMHPVTGAGEQGGDYNDRYQKNLSKLQEATSAYDTEHPYLSTAQGIAGAGVAMAPAFAAAPGVLEAAGVGAGASGFDSLSGGSDAKTALHNGIIGALTAGGLYGLGKFATGLSSKLAPSQVSMPWKPPPGPVEMPNEIGIANQRIWDNLPKSTAEAISQVGQSEPSTFAQKLSPEIASHIGAGIGALASYLHGGGDGFLGYAIGGGLGAATGRFTPWAVGKAIGKLPPGGLNLNTSPVIQGAGNAVSRELHPYPPPQQKRGGRTKRNPDAEAAMRRTMKRANDITKGTKQGRTRTRA